MERNICLDWQAIVEEAVIRRKAQRLSQEQLAVLSGVSKPTLNRFEQGQKSISLENAIKILAVLGLTKI